MSDRQTSSALALAELVEKLGAFLRAYRAPDPELRDALLEASVCIVGLLEQDAQLQQTRRPDVSLTHLAFLLRTAGQTFADTDQFTDERLADTLAQVFGEIAGLLDGSER